MIAGMSVVSPRCRRAGVLVAGILAWVCGALGCEAAPSATVAPRAATDAERGSVAALPEPSGLEAPPRTLGQGDGEAVAGSSSPEVEVSPAGEGDPGSVAAARDVGGPATGGIEDAEGGETAAAEVASASPAEAEPVVEIRRWRPGNQDSGRSGSAREAAAFANKEAEVQALFTAAGLRFPPRQVLFRVFKEEAELEVWATDDRREPLRQIATYTICAASGGAGPKTRTGDGQVPEGFYEIDFYKPRSDYYLALHVNYPNRRDRSRRSTGSAIMIHGRCASIGCLAMSDERIQELWVIGRSLHSGRVQVHMFPQRAMDTLLETTKKESLKPFWRSLAEGKRRFEAEFRLPKKIGFDGAGNYTFD